MLLHGLSTAAAITECCVAIACSRELSTLIALASIYRHRPSCLLPMPSHPTLPFSVRLSITCLLSYKLPARRRFVDSTISKCDLCTIFPSLYTSNIYFCAE